MMGSVTDTESSSRTDWVPGDQLGLQIPAHSAALRAGGTDFLTQAFRAGGALAQDNRITQISEFAEFSGGSTGRKLLLSVVYEKPAPGLPTALFVKFSRDFDDAVRDAARIQMQREARFALLSRMPRFPVAVPMCCFADYHQQTGTGILITQRVAFGAGGIERHYEKCQDYAMPAPLAHYRALVKAIARLAGMHLAGGFPDNVAELFPCEPDKLSVSAKAPYTAKQIQNRVARYAGFAASFPQLLPGHIATPQFIAQLAAQAPRFAQYQAAIRQFLCSKPEFMALCHWNANVDNAWFWRDAQGELQCGLLDWGHVSQMNIAMALWGSLSGAELELWDHHLDELLALFAAELRNCGTPILDTRELTFHLDLYIALMGLAWLLDAPPLIRSCVPDLGSIQSRFDPRFKANETARTTLQMMTTFLNRWQRRNFGTVLGEFLQR